MRVAVADAMRRSWTRPTRARRHARAVWTRCLPSARSRGPNPARRFTPCARWPIALAENSAPAGRLVGSKIVHPSADGHRLRGRGRGRRAGARHPRRGQKIAEGFDRAATTNSSSWRANASCRPNATGGSIATVTNFGTFGLEWATPIPLPEQTLVLGMGAARHEPHWDSGQGPVCAGDGGEPDVELRPSRAGRRRGGPPAFAHRGFDVQAGEVVTKFETS